MYKLQDENLAQCSSMLERTSSLFIQAAHFPISVVHQVHALAGYILHLIFPPSLILHQTTVPQKNWHALASQHYADRLLLTHPSTR